jgi:hypothetical protein
MKLTTLLAVLSCGLFATLLAQSAKHSQEVELGDRISLRPANGLVSKKETAVKIAEAIFSEQIPGGLRPNEKLVAIRVRGFWLVSIASKLTESSPGGGPQIEIDAESGAVLRFWIDQ